MSNLLSEPLPYRLSLYAIPNQGKWKWQVTINIQADIHWWRKQCKTVSDRYLLFVRHPVPVDVAFRWMATWNARPAQVDSPSTLPLIIQKAKMKNEIEYISLHAESPSLEGIQTIDNRFIDRISALLEGRMLHGQEVQSLLQSLLQPNLSEWTSDLSYVMQWAYLRGAIQYASGMQTIDEAKKRYVCQRCGSGENELIWTTCLLCNRDCPYCQACLQMGKIRRCTLLIYGMQNATMTSNQSIRKNDLDLADDERISRLQQDWGLSDAQAHASAAGIAFLQQMRSQPRSLSWLKRSFLIWAITGAGKTEMIYPLIEDELCHGGKVVIATPRKDVVLELLPRVQSHFSNMSVVALYGGSEQKWQTSPLMIATTHQLLRFRHAFDLVIVDEVDAFPYHNNKMLQYAAERACRADGAYVFLSATPPTDMMKEAKRGRLAHVKVPARYHRHPLPVPHTLSRRSYEGRIHALVMQLNRSLARGAQCFVFVPRIDHVNRLVKRLRERLPNVTIDGTSSVDPDREHKVKQFRATDIRILVTTTILERGVTIPRSDVFVLDADAELFDAAALAQMAGRAGRNVNDPHGRVYFIAANITRSQKHAIRMIRHMNRLASQNGYLLPEYRMSGFSRITFMFRTLLRNKTK